MNGVIRRFRRLTQIFERNHPSSLFLRASVPPCLRVKTNGDPLRSPASHTFPQSFVCFLQKVSCSHGGFLRIPGAFRISHGGTEARRHGDKGIRNLHEQRFAAVPMPPEFLSSTLIGGSHR